MPSLGQHIGRARANARLLNAWTAEGLPHPEWAITVAFYTAVHLVEAHFAAQGVDNQDHGERWRAIARDRQLAGIRRAYTRLYYSSVEARYGGDPIAPSDAQQVLQMQYEPARAYLCALLNVTL